MINENQHTLKIDDIIQNGLKRNTVYNLFAHGDSKILDIGYGSGTLLMQLKRDKKCTNLYGIEQKINPFFDELLDGNWKNILPDEPLDDKYVGFFNHIIMHDVLEHIYDPWSFLNHVRHYLSSSGRIIIVTPNLQYWDIIHVILNGDFPYGCGGLMNEEHIRWFTMKSLVETAIIGGLRINEAFFFAFKIVS